MAMPASMITLTRALLSSSTAFCNVLGSLALPGRMRALRTNPDASSVKANVTSGLFNRFCLLRPYSKERTFLATGVEGVGQIEKKERFAKAK